MHERRFHGRIERLRSPERLALLEVDRVAALCLETLDAQSALDVGTGSGIFAEAFARQGLEVAGIDVNPDALSAAKKYVPQGRFRQAPAEDIPYPDNSFDLVFLGLVLHETDDPVRALQEAGRLARSRICMLEWPYQEEQPGPPLAHRLQPEKVAEMSQAAGLGAIETFQLSRLVLYRLG